MKTQSPFHFSKEQSEEMVEVLKACLAQELELEASNLQAMLFLEVLNQKIGKYYYNVGIADAVKVMKEKSEDLVLLTKE